MKKFLIVFLFISSIFSLNSQCNGRYKENIFTSIDISTHKFGENKTYLNINQDLFLDVYKPVLDTFSKRPCIVFCFGGAFIQGSRVSPELVYMATELAKKGYVCASIDYRLDNALNLLNSLSSTKAVIRAVQDAKAAIRFLKSKSDSLQIDTTQIFIGGTSAGGVTAMTLGYSQYEDFEPIVKSTIDQMDGYEGNTNTLPYSSKVKGLFNFSGGIGDTLHIGTKDLPVYLNHSNGDLTVPFRSGYPLSGLSPNLIHGSFNIKQRMDNQKGYAILDSFNSTAHPAFTNQADVYATTISLNNFLYSQLKCTEASTNQIEFISENNINFYPNPTSGSITINASNTYPFSIQITNLVGQTVYNKMTKTPIIDLSSIEHGTYFISINNLSPQKLFKY